MDEQIKPVGWMRSWAYEGIDVMAIPKKDRPGGWMFRDVTRHKAMRNDVPLYSQQSIDALRAEVERWRERVAKVDTLFLEQVARTSRAEAEAEALRAEVARLKAACNQWSERERLFGAHEDLLARAVALRADAERYRWLRDFNSGGDVAELVDQNWNDDLDAAIDAARKGAE